MTRFNFLLATGACALLIMSCKPSQKAGPTEERPVVHESFPYGLAAKSKDGALEIAWKVNGTELLTGFQIYIAADSSQFKSTVPFNTTPYPGDLDPTDGVVHFTAEPLPNGIPQFVWVKILFPDLQLSPSSNIAQAVPYGRDTATLHVRFKDDHDGYSLANSGYVRSSDSDNDLYFYTASEGDFLASPSRLDGFLRSTSFAELPGLRDSEQALDILATMAMMPSEPRIKITPGVIVIVKLQSGELTILQVQKIEGTGDNRTVTFSYISGIRPEQL